MQSSTGTRPGSSMARSSGAGGAGGGSSAEDRARRAWSLGAYEAIAPSFLPMAARLVAAADVARGDAVLDVACGTGNVAITAARRGAVVTGLDLVPGMLEAARRNAAIAGVTAAWYQGTATDLPFPDDAFDHTLSCVGHVFAVPAEAAARELVRVTRPGGRIAFTSWTPDSVVPAMARALVDHLPPAHDEPDPAPDAQDSPFRWGDPDAARERLGAGVDGVRFETGALPVPVLSPGHYWKKATEESGPFIVALENVDGADLPVLREEVLAAIRPYFDPARNTVELEYRIAVATIRGG